MSEAEEFEFRRRAEAEASVAASDPLATFRAEHGPADAPRPNGHPAITIPDGRISDMPFGARKVGMAISDALMAPADLLAAAPSALLTPGLATASEYATRIGNSTGMSNTDPMAVKKRVSDALTYQPRTETVRDILESAGRPAKTVATAYKAGEHIPYVGKALQYAEKPLGDIAALLPTALAGKAGIPLVPSAVEATAGAVGSAGRAAGSVVAAPVNYFRPSKVGEKYLQKKMARPEQLPPVVDALRTAVPEQTSAEALHGTVQGAVVQALQESMAKNPSKGINIDFGEQFQRHKAAIDRESASVESALAPDRIQAIENIRKQGGINVDDFMAKLDGLADTPEAAGNPMAGTVIKTLKRIVANNSKKVTIENDGIGVDGLPRQPRKVDVVDPAIIYNFRKSGLNHVISTAANGVPSAVNAGKIGVGKSVRSLIDNSFKESGGGHAWNSYLRGYAERMEPINAREIALDEMYTPEFGKADIPGGHSQTSSVSGPKLLSRPVSLVNFGFGIRRKLMEPSVDKFIADKLRDPHALADILAKAEKRQEPITDISRLLQEHSSYIDGLPDQPIAGARYGAFGDSRTAPQGVKRLPAPGETVGGTNYGAAGVHQRALADAVRMSASEQRAALSHPGGPDLAGPRLRSEMTADVPGPWKAQETVTPPTVVALKKVMASSPQLTELVKAVINQRNKLPGRSWRGKPYEDQSLSLEPADMSPEAQSAAAARARGRKLEEALLGRKRK